MKGIILAGGSGTRLYPITKGVSKQLLPIYDKPMIFYPLSTLMLAGIRDILIITTPEDQPSFKRLLENGSQFGVNLFYAVQPKPEGLAQAFLIAEECGFLKDGDPCALILGDNIFYSAGLSESLELAADYASAPTIKGPASIFGIQVKDPERYGIAEVDEETGEIVSIEEKPKEPKSNICVTGLYFYPGDVSRRANQVKPSARGELEITTLNEMYLHQKRLDVQLFARGFAWLDTGTHDSMLDAANFIRTVETRQGLQIACLQEIAYENGWMTKDDVRDSVQDMLKTEYGQYLLRLIEE